MDARLAQRLTRRVEAIWYAGAPLGGRLLSPLEGIYRAVVALRRHAYRRGFKAVVTLPVPVIVVGNLTVGGTGKTPCVIWLARELGRRGRRVGVISRGYRGRARDWPRWVAPDADSRELGDEPVLIAERTGCPVVVGPDRVAAGRYLLERAEVDVLISDDGLQHYRLGRRVELAVVDGARGLGNGRCLPAGPLREPPGRLEEVDAVIVNGDGWPRADAFRAALEAVRVYRVSGGGEEIALSSLVGRRVHAVAAIGHPQRFFEMLRGAGLDVIPHALPDHAVIEPEDLRFSESGMILVTEKDAVKCRSFSHDDLWCVAADLRFENDNGEQLMQRVMRKLEPDAER